METPACGAMASNESKAKRSSKDRASGSPTMLSFHQKKGKFAGVVPRSDPERLQQFRRDVVEEFKRSTKTRQKSVHQMAAMFKGESKPENIEVFHKRHAQEEAAYRAKVHQGRKTLKNYSQGTDAMYNFVLKANLATTEGKERFLRRWAAGRMVIGESTTPREGWKFLKSLGIDVPRLESPRSPPQSITEESSHSPERVPKMPTPPRGRARFRGTSGRYGPRGGAGSVKKEGGADLEVVEWEKALSRAVGAMAKIDADACATRLDARARKRRSASESGRFLKSRGPQTCRGPRTRPFFGADEDFPNSHNDDSEVKLGKHRASWSPVGSRSPRRTSVEEGESPDKRLSTASRLPCPETPTSGKAVRLSLSRLSDSPGRFSLSPVRSTLSHSPPRSRGDHDVSPVKDLLLPSRLLELEEEKTSTAPAECVMEDFNHSIGAVGPKSVRKMAAMFERGKGSIRRSGSVPGRAMRNLAPETYHGPRPKPFFGACEPDLHLSRSDDSEDDLRHRSSWSPVGSRSGGSIGAMKAGECPSRPYSQGFGACEESMASRLPGLDSPPPREGEVLYLPRQLGFPGRLSLSPERTCHNFPPLGEGSLLDCSLDVSETGDGDAGVLHEQSVSLDGLLDVGEDVDETRGDAVKASRGIGLVSLDRVLNVSQDVIETGEDDAGAPLERSSESSDRILGDVREDGNDGGDSKSDDHGDAPMPLQPDDPYRDFDAILDKGSEERRSSSSPLWNLTNCCGNFKCATDEVNGGGCTIS